MAQHPREDQRLPADRKPSSHKSQRRGERSSSHSKGNVWSGVTGFLSRHYRYKSSVNLISSQCYTVLYTCRKSFKGNRTSSVEEGLVRKHYTLPLSMPLNGVHMSIVNWGFSGFWTMKADETAYEPLGQALKDGEWPLTKAVLHLLQYSNVDSTLWRNYTARHGQEQGGELSVLCSHYVVQYLLVFYPLVPHTQHCLSSMLFMSRNVTV